MAWFNHTYYSFDMETTGASPLEDRIVSATVVKFSDHNPSSKRSWLINPGIPVPEDAVAVHGLTTSFLEDHGGDPVVFTEQIIATVAQVLKAGCALIVYNAAYDLSMLEAEAKRLDLLPLTARVTTAQLTRIIDPYVLAQGYETYRTREGRWGKNYKLPSVCVRYGIPFNETHDATADAIGGGQLALALMHTYPTLASLTPAELFALQQDWRERLQTALRSALDKKKTPHDGVDSGWPFHTELGITYA